MEPLFKKFSDALLANVQARQDALAAKRDIVVEGQTHDYKRGYWSGYEDGLIVAGRRVEAVDLAADVAAAFKVTGF